MKKLWQESARRELLDRLATLRPDRPARWGRMSAPQMVTHLNDSMRMTYGDLNCEMKRSLIRFPGIKQLIIFWMPFPKGVPTAPELIARKPGEWEADVETLRTLLERGAGHDTRGPFPVHPAFGKLTPREWGVLAYRHVDHHLRQFGV
jgi:hypothetical protein